MSVRFPIRMTLRSIVLWMAAAVLLLLLRAGASAALSGPRPPHVPAMASSGAEPQDTTRFTSGGRNNRRARAALTRRSLLQAEGMLVDTSQATLALIRALPRDSSARLAQFLHVRRDEPAARGIRRHQYPMYLPDPAGIQFRDDLDSTRWVYHVRRIGGNGDTRIPTELPLDAYARVRLKNAVRQYWEVLAQSYTLEAEKKTGLADVFSKVTSIEIPVPKNPLFSIFGPNIIKLTINGAVDIHAAFRNTKSDLFTASPLGQSRSEPDFNQDVLVNVKGEIGDKLKIDADWNTQRTFEYENQLKVRYTGYEDEIVQSVEAGNVSLPTNSSFISSSQALFGLKAAFQLGPLRLTTIATQKKGQIKELSVSGGARSTPFERRAPDYSHDHYFIDASYINIYERIFNQIPAAPVDTMQIRDIEVWVSRNTAQSVPLLDRDVVAFMNEADVLFYMDPSHRILMNNVTDRVTDSIEIGTFQKLDPATDYTYNPDAGTLTMQKSLQPDQAIAVAYIAAHRDRSVKEVGNFGSRTARDSLKLALKLVRPKNLDPGSTPIGWKMMLKNRYSLGGAGINKDGFDFHILYEISGQPAVEEVGANIGLLEMFGLDRFTGDATSVQPDKVFDYLPRVTIDERRGELIFPTVEPFRNTTLEKFFLTKNLTAAQARDTANYFAYNAIYDTTYNGALNDSKNKYIFRGNVKPSTASSYSLGFNIVEGSVEVYVDGQRATANVDYTVDYMSGQVVIKNQSYLVPGKNLQIKYEANDLFQLASKSLVGARGDIALGKNTSLGFTIMNLNQQSLSDKVRLGEEPISNTIMGVDGGTMLDLPFLTKALNVLPGVQTLAPSSFTIRGEAAYMKPTPNTRTSPIASDNGKSVAYIDDFEGARVPTPLGVTFSQWREASAPYFIPGLDSFLPGPDLVIPTSDALIQNGSILADTTKMSYKGKASWFNVLPTDVTIPEIWGSRKSYVSGQAQVTALTVFFQPNVRGAYNYSMELNERLFAHPTQAWGGMQHLLGISSTNLLDQNVSFIEFWVRIVAGSPAAKMNIDLGYISEDVIPNRILNTEDGVDGNVRSGIMRPGEDLGIDMLSDDQERILYSDFVNKYKADHPEYAQDPSGDDWQPIPYQIVSPDTSSAKGYTSVNGTEGNTKGEYGLLPDTEDLNNNNVLDRTNAYFEYEIPLDATNTDFLKRVVGSNPSTGWYQLRIPLNEYARQIGQPSLTNVEGVRLWVGGAATPVLFRLAEFNLVGNQWEERVKNDSTFKVSVVNFEDDPTYVIPPGVPQLRDPSHPDQNLLLNEQSLNLVIKHLSAGESREAIKRYSYRPLDMFSYRQLKMFVHGQKFDNIEKGYHAFGYTDTSRYDAEVFLRFGADSLNYYEYRAPVHQDWGPDNSITINFADLTAIKLVRDSASAPSRPFPVPNGPPGSSYSVLGNPSLTNVRYFSIGVTNPAGKGKPELNGEVWADELRLTDVDDTPGWAYRFDTSLKLADIANIAFSYSQRDPNFHALEEHFGSRMTNRNWTLATSANLERLLPEKWNGTTLGVSYTHTESFTQPKYMPNTDILVDAAVARVADSASHGNAKTGEALRTATQTLSVTDTYAAPGLHLSVPSTSWLVTETINRMSLGYSYSISRLRSPTVEFSEAWGWNTQFSYGLPFSATNFLRPLWFLAEDVPFWKDLRFYYTPRQFSVGFTFNRNQSRDKTRLQDSPNPVVRNFTSSRSLSLTWQIIEGGLVNPAIDYQLGVTSSLVHLETDRYGNQRSFSDMLGDIFLSDRLIDFGIDQSYGQTIGLSTRMVVPPVLKFDKLFAINPSPHYSVRYDWTNNVQAGSLGRSAGWSASVNTGIDLSIKPLAESIWGPSPSPGAPEDSTRSRLSRQFDKVTRILFKVPFFDFDKVNLTFTQQNRAQNSGVVSGTGFGNLFNRAPLFESSLESNGPSTLYQLGLISDPNGTLVLKSKPAFPFITGYTVPGLRAPNGNLNDIYAQTNQVSLRTSRQLWEGADLELNWRVSWNYNQNRIVTTDSLGVPTVASSNTSGDLERSFFTMPPVLFFKFLHTSMDDVNKRYEELKYANVSGRSNEAMLSQAFKEGLEALPFLGKIFGTFAPRVNWSFRWNGLERLPVFNTFASTVSFDHVYTSTYRERWHGTSDGTNVTESQTVAYGFAPLAGVNVTFKDFTKGKLSATFRFNSTTNFDLSPAAQNVVESDRTELSFTGSFSRSGFEIPFFGLALSNDIEATFSYNYSKDTRKMFDFQNGYKTDGTPLEGSSRSVIEPRIRYVLSARVTASVYYRYTKVSPDAGGSRIPGSTINEGGLDIHVAIQ